MSSGPTLKTPPHSIEAEQSVLGGLMLNNEAWFDVAEIVSARDFYQPQHQMIFEAMAALSSDSQPLDALMVSNQLESTSRLEKAGGIAYLAEIVDGVPGASNVAAYAHIVRERADARRLLGALRTATNKVFDADGLSSADLIDHAEQCVFRVSDRRYNPDDEPSMGDLVDRALDRIRERAENGSAVTGLATGIADLDTLTAGLQKGDLVVIAGRPGMGKTSLAMNIVQHATLGRQPPAPALVYSLEMGEDPLTERLVAALGRIDFGNIKTGRLDKGEGTRLPQAANQLRDLPIAIRSVADLTPTEMRSRARRAARAYDDGLGLIVVDYLQLMRVDKSENRTIEVSEISRSLKALALEMDCPVIALSQLNRSLETRANKRPIMSDLRESGAIEQDADVILFLYRDEIYDEASADKGIAEIIVRKQRNGPIGTVRTRFFPRFVRFEDLAPSRYDA